MGTSKTEIISQEESIYFEEALERIGTGKCQCMVIIAGGVVILSAFTAISVMSFVTMPAHCDLDMGSDKKGAILSAIFIGMIAACHLWGFLSDTKGRRHILVRTLFCDVLLYVATSFSPYFLLMFVLRFIHGITSVASLVCIYSYVSEFLNSKNRSFGVLISSIIGISVYCLVSVIALAVIPYKWEIEIPYVVVYKPWRLYYAVCGIPSLLGWISIYLLPESPKFLLAAGRNKEAMQVFRRIHKLNNTKGEFNIIDVRINENEKVAKLEQNANKTVAFLNLVWRQTVPLFKPPLRFNMLLINIISFMIYFCTTGIYLWMPDTINRIVLFKNKYGNRTGTFCEIVESYQMNVNTSRAIDMQNVVTVCDDTIDTSVFVKTGITGIFQLIALVTAVLLIKVINRKLIMSVFIVLSLIPAVSLLSSAFFDYMVTKMSLVLIINTGVFPLVSSAVVDLFPTNVKSMASCLGQLSARVGTITATELVGVLIDNNCSVTVWLFAGSLAVSFIISILIPTKAKYLEEETKRPSDA